MVEEEVRNAAATLLVWSGNSGSALKRARMSAVSDVFTKLATQGVSVSLQDSFASVSKSSSLILLELGAKKKQKRYKDEPPDIRTRKADLERRKYVRLLANLFKEADLPVVQVLRTVSDPEASWVHLFAARRANTLKNRYKVLKPLRDWLEFHRGYVFPRSVNDAIDYVQFRIDEGCGKTIPESVDIALGLAETLGPVPEPDRISGDPLWKGHVKSWSAELASENPPRKPAEMFTVAMIVSLELLVADEEEPLCARALSWVVLCMVWASLRCDDVQCVKPMLTTLSNYGLRLVLTKTKTTGSDKTHKEVMAFVHRTTSLTGVDWLGIGFEIWNMDELFVIVGTIKWWNFLLIGQSLGGGLFLRRGWLPWSVKSFQSWRLLDMAHFIGRQSRTRFFFLTIWKDISVVTVLEILWLRSRPCWGSIVTNVPS